jgi:2-keto-4-pentenoate hydratase/2-oxohepta-3-ene-1,7-dioic acid hydratase in catechol pathway
VNDEKLIMTNFGRFQLHTKTFHGEVRGDDVLELDCNPLLGDAKPTKTHKLDTVKVLIPVEPSKIIAVGLNYADHAKETGKSLPAEPLIWLKAPSSLLEHRGTIRIGYPDHRTDYEAELCIVIGRKAKAISEAEAPSHIFGYTCSQDVSDRHIQKSESQWARAKSFDSYTPLGPFIRTGIDPSNLQIQLLQNDQVRQNSRTNQMIFSVPFLVHFISQNITLFPGDIILTGTPSGIGPIKAGDQLEVRIEGLYPLKNDVGNSVPTSHT